MNDIVPFQEIQKEAAKAFGQETAANVFGFLADITRQPAKELGGLLADHVRYFRFKTQLKILKKAKKFHGFFGCKPQEVPLKFIANLLDNCSWEENEDMQTRWAALLANAANQGESTTDYVTYVELLRQLTPIQAMCLEVMYEERDYPARLYSRQLPSYQSAHTLKLALSIADDQLHVLFDSLMRLNLIHVKLGQENDTFDTQNVGIERSYEESSLTYLGQALIKKCRIPFTEQHKKKIRAICMDKIEEVARDPNGKPLDTLFDAMKEVYGYMTDNDVRAAVWSGFRKYIWKGDQITKHSERPLGTDLRIQIVDMIIEELNRIHA
ncbi:MAG: DUF4393 domain-containing protein [Candidatus Marinimicrobia bacterium]|nr:DUF4393 domain-containing protein [Candidatus Neomarinimicrobiota bacterium]